MSFCSPINLKTFIVMLIMINSMMTALCFAQSPDSTNQTNHVFTKTLSRSIGNNWKTLGGKQFWTDIHHCGGWRIQENAVSGHYRLLDNENRRHHSGTFEDCLAQKNELLNSGKIVPHQGRVVIVLHGLIRTTGSMRRLAQYLRDESDFAAIDFEYASTRRPVAYHADALAKVIDSLGPDVTEISFVAHSMGNIVVRHFLADTKNRDFDRKFGRMVMIGPPNQGSRMATMLRWSFLFKVIAGPAGIQLGAGWEKLEPHLVAPPFEFGIIAGGQSDRQKLSNFFLNGKDDFTVSVEETRLAGASDFMVQPLLHATMMSQPVTLKATLNFLEHGYFESPETRQPIPTHDDR